MKNCIYFLMVVLLLTTSLYSRDLSKSLDLETYLSTPINPYNQRFLDHGILNSRNLNHFFTPYQASLLREKKSHVHSFVFQNSFSSHFYNKEILTSGGNMYSREGLKEGKDQPNSYAISSTYFAGTYEPSFAFINAASFSNFDMLSQSSIGVGIYMPFEQEFSQILFYPVINQSFFFDTRKGFYIHLSLGSISPYHDMPEPMLDSNMGNIALNRDVLYMSKNVDYKRESSRGHYEYGASIQTLYMSKYFIMNNEVFIDWQRKNIPSYKERFSLGVVQRLDIYEIPLYTAIHYWHTGGQEYNVEPLNEVINFTAGFRNDTWELLYFLSHLKPGEPYSTPSPGHGILTSYKFDIPYGFYIRPSLWMSSEFFDHFSKDKANHTHYNTIDGFAQAKAPLYFMADLGWSFKYSYYLHFNIMTQTGLYLTTATKKGDFATHVFSFQGIFFETSYNFDFIQISKNQLSF